MSIIDAPSTQSKLVARRGESSRAATAPIADITERGYIGPMTRYTQLRGAIAHLAASPDAQIAYLDEIFASLTRGSSAAGYGNNELALDFDDIFLASEHMHECGEITEAEIASIRPLDEMLKRFCEQRDDAFWKREALFVDPRWEAMRSCAATIISSLPEEERESDYLRSLRDDS